jgi:hypothetical protein
MPINVKIWFKHGSKSALVNLRPPTFALPNIKGLAPESNIIFWG